MEGDNLEMLDGIPLGDLSAPVLLGIVVLSIVLGRLIPRPTYLDKVKESENWRRAYEKERDSRDLSEAQKAELLEAVKVTNDILYAMFDITTEESRQSGGRHRV